MYPVSSVLKADLAFARSKVCLAGSDSHPSLAHHGKEEALVS